MTDDKMETTVTGGTQQGVIGAGTVVIENFTVYNRPVEETHSSEAEAGPISPCPYPGLAYFGPEDTDRFFGRDAAVARLAEAVGRQRFTALVGASGSGKSSVVLAGLAPHLHRRGGWRFSHFRNGTELERDPFLALARALVPLYVASASDTERLKNIRQLARSLRDGTLTLRDVFADCRSRNKGTRILLIADQFEEAFTLVEDEALRHRFIDLLLAGFPDSPADGAPDICLILTLRADFYGRALRHRPLADALQGHVENLGPMTREELREAIVRPAEGASVSYEPGLVETLLDEVGGKPGSLPLLQFALREMWARQEGRRITRRCYDAIGGVEGALAQRAQAIFAALTDGGAKPQTEESFRRFFTRLVTLGEGQEDTRRVVERHELGDELWALAQRLAGEDNRLVVTNAPADGRETAEVVHEALIRHWPTLVGWIDRDRAFQTWLRQIRPSLELWVGHPDDDGPLLRGGPLAQAADWLARRRDDLSEAEQGFIEASLALQERAEAEKEAAERERRELLEERARILERTSENQRRSLRNLRFALAAFAIAVAVAGFFALQQHNLALRERQLVQHAEGLAAAAAREARRARSAELVTRARTLFEQTPGQNATAALLAIESLRLGGGSEAQGLISEILALTPRRVRDLPGISPDSRIVQSPDGKMNLVWTHDGYDGGPGAGTVVLLDPTSGAVRALIEHEGWVQPALDPAGRWLAVGGYGRRFQLVDLTTGESVLDETRPGLTVAAFSPDGARLYIAEGGGAIEVRAAPNWDLLSRAAFREGEWDNFSLSIVLAPDSETLLISKADGAWLGPPGGPFQPLPDLQPLVNHAVFDPTGTHILTMSQFRRVQLRNATNGVVVAESWHANRIASAAFSIDGTRLVIGDEHGIVEIWDTKSGARLLVLDHDRKKVSFLGFTPDGSQLLAAYASGAVRMFDPREGAMLHEWARPAAATGAAFGEDSASLYLGDALGAIHRFDLGTGEAIEIFRSPVPPESGVWPLTAEPQSALLLAGLRNSRNSHSWTTLRAIDIETEQELWHQAHNGLVSEASFSPDGTVFATRTFGTEGNDLTIWDAATGERLHQPSVQVYRDGLRFTRDGERLVASSDETQVVDPKTGAVLFGIGEPGGVDSMVLLPDRKTVVTYGRDGVMRGWDASSGEDLWRRSAPDLDWDTPFSGNAARYARRAPNGQGIVVHNTRSGSEVVRLAFPWPYSRLALSPTGDRVLVTSWPTTDPATGKASVRVELWDSDRAERLQELRGEGPVPAYIDFGPDGYAQVFMPHDRLTVLDSATGAVLWEEAFQRDWTGNPADLPRTAGAPLVIRGGGYTSLRNARSGDEIRRLDFGIGGYTVTADRSRMVATLSREPGETGPQIAMIDVGTGGQIWTAEVSGPDEGYIADMRFSDDERRLLVLLTGSSDSSVFLKVLSASDGRVVATLSSESRVTEVEQLADPDLVVTRDLSKTARTWRLSTGEELRRVAHGHSTNGASVATEAPRAVTRKEGSLRVWDLRDGSEIAHRITEGLVEEATIDPSGRLVAYRMARAQRTDSGDPFQAILLWDIGENGTLRRIPIQGMPTGLAFDRSGRRLAARLGDHEIRIWDVASLRPFATLRSTPGGKFSSGEHHFSTDGDYFFAREQSSATHVYTTQLRTWRLSEEGETHEIARLDGVRHSAEAANGTLLAVGTGRVRAWDLGSGGQERLAYPEARFCCTGVAGPDRRVLYQDFDAIRALDVASGETIEMRRDPASDSLSAAAFSEDMSRVFLAERDSRNAERVPGAVRLRSVPDGREIAHIRPDATISRIIPADGGKAALLLGSPGGWIVRGTYERALLWRPDESRLLQLDADSPMSTAAVSPDGRFVVLGEGAWYQDGERWIVRGEPRVTVWDSTTGERLHGFVFDRPPSGIGFSRDGTLMAAHDNHSFAIYAVDEWGEFQREEARISYGALIGIVDNEWVVLPEINGLRLLSLSSGEEASLPHNTVPTFITSNSGDVFATIDRDSLRVWQVSRLSEERPPSVISSEGPHETPSRTAADRFALLAKFDRPERGRIPIFAGIDNHLFIGGENALTHLLYRAEEIEAEVCRRMGRGLTEAEIIEFFGQEPPANPCGSEQ